MQEYMQKLRNLREDHDKSQKEIAEYLGTSQTMYARYERGANELPIRHFAALCKYYHVSADYLLGFSSKKTLDPPRSKNAAASKNIGSRIPEP